MPARRDRLGLFLVVVALVFAASSLQADRARDHTAGCAWTEGFSLADLSGPVSAMAVWNDGSGEALYVGGAFTTAGGVEVRNIARWDGSSWSVLAGPGEPGTDGPVNTLMVWDDGSGEALYVGGTFTNAGGVLVNKIARWSGLEWSALGAPGGPGVPVYVTDIQTMAGWDDGSGEALFVGGSYPGSLGGSGVVKWDGVTWSTLGGGVSNPLGGGGAVNTLAIYQPEGEPSSLFVGGDFVYAAGGGLTVNYVASWDGTSWSALSDSQGTGVDGSVLSLVVWNDGGGEALFVGGGFNSAGNLPVHNVARWTGSAWSALTGPSGTGTGNTIAALEVWDDGTGEALFVGGLFTSAGGLTANRVARWDGGTWSPLSAPSGNGVGDTQYDGVHALATWDSGVGEALYVGGDFITAGGLPVRNLATWDGALWSAPTADGGNGIVGTVYAVAAWDDGTGPGIFAGGSFHTVGATAANNIARWDGSNWSPLEGPTGEGTENDIRALAVWDDGTGEALYAGGAFTTAGGVAASRIARWDGTSWSRLSGPGDDGMDGVVDTLTVWDDGSGDALYAGGWFETAGGVVVNRIAKWDGNSWSALAGPADIGMNRAVHDLAVWDDGTGEALYVGGYFFKAGGIFAYYVAKWDGVSWSALPPNTLNGRVYSLATWDDGTGEALYVGGTFTRVASQTVLHVAKWDGLSWTPLATPAGTGTDDSVQTLHVWDDGSGEVLYAGGWFERAGGVTANLVARWDGLVWTALSGPLDTGLSGHPSPAVYSLANWDYRIDNGLVAGGSFDLAGGIVSANIANWACGLDIFSDGFESGDTSAWAQE